LGFSSFVSFWHHLQARGPDQEDQAGPQDPQEPQEKMAPMAKMALLDFLGRLDPKERPGYQGDLEPQARQDCQGWTE